MHIEIPVTLNEQRKIVMSYISGKFEEGDFKGNFYIGGTTILLNHADRRQWSVSVRDIIDAIYKSQQTGELEKTAEEILKEHCNILGSDSDLQKMTKDILAAMKEYRKLGRYYTADEIATIQSESYKAGFNAAME